MSGSRRLILKISGNTNSRLRHSILIAVTLVAICLVTTVAVHGERLDDRSEVISEYARGKRLMRESNWLEASRVFEQMAGRFPESKNIDLFLFNRAKAQYYFGNLSDAMVGFAVFVKRFSSSGNLPHAYFFLGNLQYLKGYLDQAVASYIRGYGLSNEPRLSRLLVSSLTAAISNAKSVSLTPYDLVNLPESKRCDLVEPLVAALIERHEYSAAQKLSLSCGREIDIPDDDRTQNSRFKAEVELAMVLPLSGDLQSFGEEIYNGAIIAADFYRSESGRNLKLAPYDTQGDPINAARIIKELIHSSTDAVIGPLTSEEAAVAAAMLSNETLPMIAPAATETGLTLLSEATFQLSPNVEYQGVQMAEYAVFNRRADSAAIISPTSSDEMRMVRAFIKRFEQLGGHIVAVEYYRSRDKNFGDYIQDIKALLLGLHPDSMFFVDDMGDTLEGDGIPAGLDCMFLPGNPTQLRQLLPQINFYNLNAFYLGSDGWGDDAVYRLGDNVTKGAVFPSPYLQQRQSEEYLKFAAAYDLRYGKRPDRLASLGYDAVRLITAAIGAGASSREELLARLSEVRGYDGAAAAVTFGKHRENIELPLYNIVAGAAEFMGKSQSISVDTETEP